MEYKVNDQWLNASVFIPFVNKVWPGDYDEEKTQSALSKTLNISAYENNVLVGCLRILSDGYFFGTITELLVLPEYQKRGMAASSSSLLRIIRQPCCILAHSRELNRSTKGTVANGACNPTQ